MTSESSAVTSSTARIDAWLTEPLPADVAAALQRLARADDVRRIAVMPDVHLAGDVCIGTVAATTRLVYPAAVGGDTGCGVAAARVAHHLGPWWSRSTAACASIESPITRSYVRRRL